MSNSGSDREVVYGQKPGALRLRIISSENDSYSKFLRISLVENLSWIQVILAAIICILQVIAMNLFDLSSIQSGPFMPHMDCGIWSSGITMCASAFTIWTLKSPIYWKLHVTFIAHLISVSLAIYAIITEYIGNIWHIIYKVRSILFREFDDNIGSGSPHIFILFLVFTVLSAIGILAQIGISSILSILTARAVICGSSKDQRPLYNLEFDRDETPDHETNKPFTPEQ